MTKQYDPVPARKTAFLGLGVMGYPMAGHLKGAGHDVTVYNRTVAKAADWAKKFGGGHAATPREAAKDCDVVACCVGLPNVHWQCLHVRTGLDSCCPACTRSTHQVAVAAETHHPADSTVRRE